MVTASIILGACSLLIWTYLLLGRGFFWRISRAAVPPFQASAKSPRVVAIVPARDEADVIGTVVEGLLTQRGVDLPVIVVDDGSSDGTADVARSVAAKLGRSAQLTIVPSAPLPPGWTGKLWAMQQGIERAREFQPEWLFLSDADVVQGENTVAPLASLAAAGSYDLASFMVRLRCKSFAEKLLIPAFVYFFFKLYPPAWIRDEHDRTAGAAGGCVLLRRSALDRAGGLDAIRGEIIDDCSLAQLIKRSGGRLWLGLTEESHSIREYESFGAIERMVSRTAFSQLNHSALLLLGTVLGMALTYLIAPLLLLSGSVVAAALGIVSWAVMAGTYLGMVRYYRLSAVWAFTLPAAAVFYVAATVHSALKFWSGAGGEWKGRAQDVGSPRAQRASETH